MKEALRVLFAQGFSAKDIERLRQSAASADDKRWLATELDAFLHRAAVTLLPPQRAALWFQIAEAYREGGATAEALRSYRLAVNEDPTHAASARASPVVALRGDGASGRCGRYSVWAKMALMKPSTSWKLRAPSRFMSQARGLQSGNSIE